MFSVYIIIVVYVLCKHNVCCRNCRWKFKNDSGYDMDDHLEVRHPRHIRGGDDCQGGSVAVVSTQDSPVQERQRSKLPSQVCFVQFYYIAPAIFFSSYFKSAKVE